MLTGLAVLAAGGTEIVKNGGFETIGSSGLPSDWEPVNVSLGTNCEISSDAKSGSKSIRFYSESESMHIVQVIDDLIPQKEYTLTAALKRIKGTGGAIKVEFRDSADKVVKEGETYKAFKDAALNEWTSQSVSFTVPQNAAITILLVRLVGGGDVLWDDIYIIGEKIKADSQTTTVTNTTVAVTGARVSKKADFKAQIYTEPKMKAGEDGNEQCLQNGSLEYLTAGELATWGKVINGELDKRNAFRTNDAHSGDYAIHFKAE